MDTLLPKIFSKIVKMTANVLFLNQHVHTIIEVKTKSVHLELIITWSRHCLDVRLF
jgi:hypothetical protein